MPVKKAKESKIKQWTFEAHGEFVHGNISNFVGKIKDEKGKVVIILREDEDYSQMMHLIESSKYMKNINDMRGLAQWVFDRNLIPMPKEERDIWKKNKHLPLDIKLVKV